LRGRTTDFSEQPSCRLKAAFRAIVERRLQAAEKNPVVRPGCEAERPRCRARERRFQGARAVAPAFDSR
jgi:hypothetical protein